MDKFRIGGLVKVTDAKGKVFKGVIEDIASHGVVGVRVPEGHTTDDGMVREEYTWNFTPEELAQEPFGDYGLRIEPRTETEQPTAPFTLLDDEGRKALKAGDRVLVEAMLHEDVGFGGDGDVELRTQGSEFEMGAFVRVSGLFALLPPAKKPAAVGDFVNILGRTGSKGKVLAFASNGHAVVEYAAGDGLNVAAYDLSCLEVV